MKRTAMTVALLVFLSAFVVTVTVPPRAKATTLYVGGGGPGNYTTIQQAIFAAGTGDTVFVYNGTYYEQIEIYKPLTLIGESREATIINGNGTGDVIRITYDWVNISNISVTNTGTPWYESNGIHILRSEHCRVSNSNISQTGRGVYLDESNNNTIVENEFYWQRYEGVNITLSDSNTVSGNNISWATREGIGLYMSDWNVLSSNSISFRNWYGIHLEYSHGNTIAEQTIWKADIAGVLLDHSNGNTIHNSTVSSSRSCGIVLQYSSDGNTIRDNRIDSNEYGFTTFYSTENLLLHNSFISNTENGITLRFSDPIDDLIEDNTVSGSARGIFLWDSDGKVIRNNTVLNNIEGIYLLESDNTVVQGNTVLNNTEGIYLDTSTGNIVRGNNVSENSMRGIYIDTSTANSFAYNNVSNNSVGFYTYSSSNNWIFHNNIMDNLDQAFNSDNTNEWDFGYSRGGNYWSDYVGVDANMGPNQDVPGSDGIGDTPRPVDMGNEDRYPLMNPAPPPMGPPSPPRNLQTTAGNDSITLSWNPPAFNGRSPITRYNIYRGTASGGETYLDYVVTKLTYEDANVSECQMYFYQVTAENDLGESIRSNEVNGTAHSELRGPSDLDALLSGGSLEDVTVTWSLSPDDGVGCGFVVRYEAYRGVSFHPEGIGYQFAGSVPNGTSSFVDSLTGDGNPNDYFYRICAVNVFNETNCSAGQAAKFTRPLSQGPNLISIPLIQSNESVETVLQTVEYDKAWYYDPSRGEWKWYMKFKTYSRGLLSMNHTMGLWINVTEYSYITVAGLVPPQTAIQLFKGWNLVSFPSFNTSFTVADLGVETGATRVEGVETMPPFPPYRLRVLGDMDVLQAGSAYWVRVGTDIIWTVEVA